MKLELDGSAFPQGTCHLCSHVLGEVDLPTGEGSFSAGLGHLP